MTDSIKVRRAELAEQRARAEAYMREDGMYTDGRQNPRIIVEDDTPDKPREA